MKPFIKEQELLVKRVKNGNPGPGDLTDNSDTIKIAEIVYRVSSLVSVLDGVVRSGTQSLLSCCLLLLSARPCVHDESPHSQQWGICDEAQAEDLSHGGRPGTRQRAPAAAENGGC